MLNDEIIRENKPKKDVNPPSPLNFQTCDLSH